MIDPGDERMARPPPGNGRVIDGFSNKTVQSWK